MPATELTPVSHHLFKAVELIRLLPVVELEREEMYTWVYQLICAALDIIVKDEMKGKPDRKQDPVVAQRFKADLKDLFGE
jgi:hypothetical protein